MKKIVLQQWNRLFCPGDFQSMLTYLKTVALITPPYLIKSSDQLGVPIATMLVCYMHTTEGREFFANPKVNGYMVKLVNKYGELLKSSESLTVFNSGQYGWLSTCARKKKYWFLLSTEPFNQYLLFMSIFQ